MRIDLKTLFRIGISCKEQQRKILKLHFGPEGFDNKQPRRELSTVKRNLTTVKRNPGKIENDTKTRNQSDNCLDRSRNS